MEKFKGKWCINVTDENKSYLKTHLKCGAGYYLGQTLFFNEKGISKINNNISWNMATNNICNDVKYNEISFIEFQNMINKVEGELTYEIY